MHSTVLSVYVSNATEEEVISALADVAIPAEEFFAEAGQDYEGYLVAIDVFSQDRYVDKALTIREHLRAKGMTAEFGIDLDMAEEAMQRARREAGLQFASR